MLFRFLNRKQDSLSGRLPDFLIIGAQKCGTTSLFYYLSQHPELHLPTEKEIHYFDLNFEKGTRWYTQFFGSEPAYAQKFTGEASPYYLFHPFVPERVASLVPEVKLIVLLRDPVERAYSHYMHQRKMGNEPLDSFPEAIRQEESRLMSDYRKIKSGIPDLGTAFRCYSYLHRGLYYDQIKRWLNYFPLSQFHFIRSETFFQTPEKTMEAVQAFLKITKHTPSDLRPMNTNLYTSLPDLTRKELYAFFAEDIDNLTKLIGNEFRWG
jgi:hypothetical protein